MDRDFWRIVQHMQQLVHGVDVLAAILNFEAVEEPVGCILGVTNNEENKIYLLKEAHLRQPNGKFEHSVILILAGSVVIDDI